MLHQVTLAAQRSLSDRTPLWTKKMSRCVLCVGDGWSVQCDGWSVMGGVCSVMGGVCSVMVGVCSVMG